MPLCLWQKYAPCPEAEILRFEEARGIRLPSLLRDFLLVHDGAEANDLESIIYTKDPNCPLEDLLPARVIGMKAHYEGAPTIPELTDELRDFIPRSGIPFAQDTFGSYLIVDSDLEEIDFVSLNPHFPYSDVGCFPTGLYLKDIMSEIVDASG
jgi:hypothetical protein